MNMRQNITYLLFASIILLVASCSGNNSHENVTTGEPKVDSLTAEVFIIDSLLQHPTSMTVTDTEFVIANFKDADSLISIYTLDGVPATMLMPKGPGPKEAQWIPNIQYNREDKSLYAPDLNKKSIFHITDYTVESPMIETVMSLKSESETDSIILQGQIVRMANGMFLAANTTLGGMIAEFDNTGKPLTARIPFPDKNRIDEKLTDWANIQLFYPTLKVSPDGKFAVATYDVSDMRIFMTAVGDKIDYNIMDGAVPNDIYVAQSGPDAVQAYTTKKTRLYTQDLTLSDRYAYQLYIDMTKEEMGETDFFKETKRNGSNTVRVYDRDGNLVKILTLNVWVKAIAVSPDDNYLYGLTESGDGFTILRYAM